MKILILSKNQSNQHNIRHELFKEEIARQHDVRFFGPEYEGFSHFNKVRCIQEILDLLNFEPDVIFTYLAKLVCKWIVDLKDCKIPKVHYIADYLPIVHRGGRLLWIGRDEDPFIEENKPDLVLCPTSGHVSDISRQHPYTKVERLPFSVNTDVFRSGGLERDIDISAIMTTEPRYYPLRQKIVDVVSEMPNSKAIGGRGFLKERAENPEYVNILSRSKIVVNDTTFNHTTTLEGGKWRPLNPRFLEATACGALLLTGPASDMWGMGFVPGENCDTFETIDEMKGKAKWYLMNHTERKRVARKGQALARKRHNCKKRVKQLTDMIERIL